MSIVVAWAGLAIRRSPPASCCQAPPRTQAAPLDTPERTPRCTPPGPPPSPALTASRSLANPTAVALPNLSCKALNLSYLYLVGDGPQSTKPPAEGFQINLPRRQAPHFPFLGEEDGLSAQLSSKMVFLQDAPLPHADFLYIPGLAEGSKSHKTSQTVSFAHCILESPPEL